MGKLSFWGKTSIYQQKIAENWKASNICISHEICLVEIYHMKKRG
jgi:hypothetical protein